MVRLRDRALPGASGGCGRVSLDVAVICGTVLSCADECGSLRAVGFFVLHSFLRSGECLALPVVAGWFEPSVCASCQRVVDVRWWANLLSF